MEQSLLILGRQPALGLAELESLYGASHLQPVGTHAALLFLPPEKINFARLGGSIRLCNTLTTMPTTSWQELEAQLIAFFPDVLKRLQVGKIRLGISAYNIKSTPARLHTLGLKLKQTARIDNRTLRFVPNQTLELNAAQVLHNRLTSSTGVELVLVQNNNHVIVAQTIAIQDIESYTLRDRGRPKRDTRVGMLPPKLAQIIINTAAAEQSHGRLLDPFCGTGVILQEAALIGFDVYGTDLEPRMINYTTTNLAWLVKQRNISLQSTCEIGDATTFTWSRPIDIVASEAYLGRPFTSHPNEALLSQTIHECNTILTKFLKNISSQIITGTRLCLAVPAWQTSPDVFQHLPLIDHLSDLGYNRVSFTHVRSNDLFYYREQQIVARELLVLTRK